jgi:hypothetical protein
MSDEQRFRYAFGAALAAVAVMVGIAIALNDPQIAGFSIPAAAVAVLAVRLATRR